MPEWLDYWTIRYAPKFKRMKLANCKKTRIDTPCLQTSYEAVAEEGGWDRTAPGIPYGEYGIPHDVAATPEQPDCSRSSKPRNGIRF